MARTNAQIIMDAQMELMKEGKLGTTGRTLVYKDMKGEVHEIPEPEPIHTYAVWKSLGYQVKKGEKAIAKFTIWKHTVKKADTEDEKDKTRMFMTMAAFFSPAQVEKAAAKA